MINFMIPGLYENYSIIIPFLWAWKNNPEVFYDDINIGAVFGNFQYCTWDGGRVFVEYTQATLEDIQQLKQIYNYDLNIPMRFPFTTTKFYDGLQYDHFNNLVLKECDNGMNEIIVNNEQLEEYLRKEYPSYNFISSTTKCLINQEKALKELNKDYKYICLDYNLNKNKKFLDSLTNDQKNKVEFLINAICPSGCQYRSRHYDLNSYASISYKKTYFMGNGELCGMKGCFPVPKFRNNFTVEEVFEYYKNGFQNFKIEGRTLNNITVLLHLVEYMVKPEYHNQMISYCNTCQNMALLDNYSTNYFNNPELFYNT